MQYHKQNSAAKSRGTMGDVHAMGRAEADMHGTNLPAHAESESADAIFSYEVAHGLGKLIIDATKALQRDVVKMAILGCAAITYRWLQSAAQNGGLAAALLDGPLAIAIIVRKSAQFAARALKRFFGLASAVDPVIHHRPWLRRSVLATPPAIVALALRHMDQARRAAAAEAELLARQPLALKLWRCVRRSRHVWQPRLERYAGLIASIVGTGSAIKYLLR